MSMRYGLFDSTEIIESESGYPRGDKAESAEFFARYFASFVGNGVYARPSDSFQVFAYDGLTIKISAGSAFIGGYFAFDDSDAFITLTSGVSDTIFRVILRLDTGSGVISLATLEGDRALTRMGEIYELGLADVTVAAGAMTISQSAVSDLRADSSLCGFVTGIIEQLDTSTYAAQLDGVIANAQDAYDGMTEYITFSEDEFDEWFEAMKNQLSTDAAGHLEQSKAEKDFSNVISGSVTTALIADGAVSGAKLAGGSVTETKMADGAITEEKLADNSVTETKIADGAIKSAKLYNCSVTESKLSAAAVTAEKIAAMNVTADKLSEEIQSRLEMINTLFYGIKLI